MCGGGGGGCEVVTFFGHRQIWITAGFTWTNHLMEESFLKVHHLETKANMRSWSWENLTNINQQFERNATETFWTPQDIVFVPVHFHQRCRTWHCWVALLAEVAAASASPCCVCICLVEMENLLQEDRRTEGQMDSFKHTWSRYVLDLRSRQDTSQLKLKP